MNFCLVPWWISELVKDLILVRNYNNEIKIEKFWFISNEVYFLWAFIWWRNSHIFQKFISSLKTIELNEILQTCYNYLQWAIQK
jgi:hypothetical protein